MFLVSSQTGFFATVLLYLGHHSDNGQRIRHQGSFVRVFRKAMPPHTFTLCARAFWQWTFFEGSPIAE